MKDSQAQKILKSSQIQSNNDLKENILRNSISNKQQQRMSAQPQRSKLQFRPTVKTANQNRNNKQS